jgi:glucans biosynthesis protein C
MPSQQFRRYHALDALRAAMMLLGLVLHSAVSYTTVSLEEAWHYQDAQRSAIFDMLVFFIHLFRMPVFFVVAGFFAALLYYRDGGSRFAANRARRVLLPLAVFWIPLFPLVRAGFTFANVQAAGSSGWDAVAATSLFADLGLMHLWFLWDLAIFYVAAVILVPLAGRLASGGHRAADDLFGKLATSWWGAVLLGLITAVTLLPMSKPALDTAFSLLPPIRVLVAYGVFFAFGWLLYRRRDLIEPFGARWKLPFALGTLVSLAYLVVTVGRPIADPTLFHLTGVTLAGLAIWLLVFGIMGAFVTWLDRPNPLVRYFSDGAYWIYLVHLPLTIWLPGLLSQSPWPAPAKFLIVLSVTTAVTTVTYHVFVRSTFVGALLNGRRYPRGLPRAAPVVEHVEAT